MSDYGVSSYRRYLQGDHEALEECIRTYSDALVRFAYCYVKDAAAAEDIMEETFATLIFKGGSFPSEGHFRAYLYRVARNKAIDHLRRYRCEVPLTDVENVLHSGDLEQDAIRQESRRKIYVCMQALPPQYREVLQMTYFDNFSVEMVCAVLHKSAKQVYNLLARAKAALRKLLETEGVSYEDL